MLKSRIAASVVLGLIAAATVQELPGQNAKPIGTMLTATDRIYTGIPRFGVVGHPSCDGDGNGNVVFNVRSQLGPEGPFLRINHDGKKHLLYITPPEAKSLDDVHWAISPKGTFSLLFGDFRSPYRLATYKSDGSLDHITPTNIPLDVGVQYFAVNDQDRVFVQGSRAGDAKKNVVKSEYAAILDGDGRVIRDLSPVSSQEKTSRSDLPEGEAIAGSDGRFYILHPTSVTVVNSNGIVENTFQFVKPDPRASTNRIDYSDGLLSIEFYIEHPIAGMTGTLESRVSILDAQTGALRGNYGFDAELTGSIVCFTREEGYSMLAIDDRKDAAFDVVPLR